MFIDVYCNLYNIQSMITIIYFVSDFSNNRDVLVVYRYQISISLTISHSISHCSLVDMRIDYLFLRNQFSANCLVLLKFDVKKPTKFPKYN